MKSDYEFLKVRYGEKFAKLCRELFPTILETKGVLAQIISDHFAPTHSLGEDLQNAKALQSFKNYVDSFFQMEVEEQVSTGRSPEDLMDEAGYILYPECQNEADIQSFKKYYAPREELCTFRGHRLNTNRVWFAVKKNVDEIKRENFRIPERQDEYGTSVISIQFSRYVENQTLSIKNRYNHAVNNPDATFSNDLNNIIPGLSKAFEEYYGCRDVFYEQKSLDIPHYVHAVDGRYYRENFESGAVSYCENNVVIVNGQPLFLDPSRQILVEDYVFDFQNNQVVWLNDYYLMLQSDLRKVNLDDYNVGDGFTKSLGDIDKIEVLKAKVFGGKMIKVYSDDSNRPKTIVVNKHHEIISYSNHDVEYIDKGFLFHNHALTELNLPNVTQINDLFLHSNQELRQLSLPKVTQIGESFLARNQKLSSLQLPAVTKMGWFCLEDNLNLTPEATELPNLDITADAEQFFRILGNNENRDLIYQKIVTTQKKTEPPKLRHLALSGLVNFRHYTSNFEFGKIK